MFESKAPEIAPLPPPAMLASASSGDVELKLCVDCHKSLAFHIHVDHRTYHMEGENRIETVTPIDFETDGSLFRLMQVADANGILPEPKLDLLRAMSAVWQHIVELAEKEA